MNNGYVTSKNTKLQFTERSIVQGSRDKDKRFGVAPYRSIVQIFRRSLQVLFLRHANVHSLVSLFNPFFHTHTHTGLHRVKYSSSFSLFNRIVLCPSFKTQEFLETYSFYRCFFPTTNETFCLCSFTLKWRSLLLFVALPLSPQHGSLFELCEGNTEVTGTVRTKSSAVSSLASIAEDLSVARLSSCSTASFQSNEPPLGVWCSADNLNT